MTNGGSEMTRKYVETSALFHNRAIKVGSYLRTAEYVLFDWLTYKEESISNRLQVLNIT